MEFTYSNLSDLTDSTCFPQTFYIVFILLEKVCNLIIEDIEYSDINNETYLEITSKEIVKLRFAVTFKCLSGEIHNLTKAIIRWH